MKNSILLIVFLVTWQNLLSQEIKLSHDNKEYFKDIETHELIDEMPDGDYLVFVDEAKSILDYKGSIINHKRVNTWTWFFETGVKRIEIVYLNGLQNELTAYYPNGNKSVTRVYSQGVPNGPFARWFQNGAISITGAYLNGNPSGIWKYFKEDGALIQEKEF